MGAGLCTGYDTHEDFRGFTRACEGKVLSLTLNEVKGKELGVNLQTTQSVKFDAD